MKQGCSVGQSGPPIITPSGHHLTLPEGVVADGTGTLYIADRGRRVLRRVTADGNSVTLVGPPELAMPTGLAGAMPVADPRTATP